jgi:hypothetical protein
VVVDIAVLEVSKNWERTWALPGPAAWASLCSPAHHLLVDHVTSSTGSTSTTTGACPTLYNLAHLKATILP